MSDQRIPTDVDLFKLPQWLPEPENDGAADHLLGIELPHVRLRSTSGTLVDIAEVTARPCVLYFYPATVKPGIPIPGEWSEIPGARGCTLQSCGYRDEHAAFRSVGCRVFGISSQGQDPEQGLEEQVEFAARVRLPFELLNDSRFEMANALRLPTFVARLRSPTVRFEGSDHQFPLQGRTLYKRLTLVADRGRVEKVFYPVFPPDRDAAFVLDYLRGRL